MHIPWATGETLLHVLIICDTKLHTRLARLLLKCFPKLALDVVEGEDYLGEWALRAKWAKRIFCSSLSFGE